jgi:hypothetical protein
MIVIEGEHGGMLVVARWQMSLVIGPTGVLPDTIPINARSHTLPLIGHHAITRQNPQ